MTQPQYCTRRRPIPIIPSKRQIHLLPGAAVILNLRILSTGERLLSRAAFICWPVGGSSARNVFVEADCAGAEGAGDGEEGEEECGFHVCIEISICHVHVHEDLGMTTPVYGNWKPKPRSCIPEDPVNIDLSFNQPSRIPDPFVFSDHRGHVHDFRYSWYKQEAVYCRITRRLSYISNTIPRGEVLMLRNAQPKKH
ncbi:uncharacterized protein ACHE_30653A [Aspergillus chevalieri]|uniref:Uncharacterized protein n=1 Tax=Aspergillus chevalieri TaxID=182096 RepID=A0A7R7VL95_ASPCH|nr:uncharacterized protein ACHE_30653A [Aspergillus chevalieri]BCR86666.1 hypothetical protein ACHE_30653A [Aspergillus chevalieri]